MYGTIEGESLGRLNMVRAPGKVREKALQEAMKTIATGEEVHGPQQNIALYENLVNTNTELSQAQLDAAGTYFGKAADKNRPVTGNTVKDVNKILGIDGLTETQIDVIATKAEEIRYERYLAHE